MNTPKCPNCGLELREQWSSKVKIMKSYEILKKYGITLEDFSRAFNINLGQAMLMAKEADARRSGEDRQSPF
jgi:hypothetical protein